MSSPAPGPDDVEPGAPAPCPRCGAPLRWISTELDTEGGWWQCRSYHRWKLRHGELFAIGTG